MILLLFQSAEACALHGADVKEFAELAVKVKWSKCGSCLDATLFLDWVLIVKVWPSHREYIQTMNFVDQETKNDDFHCLNIGQFSI